MIDLNTCQRAFAILAQSPGATVVETAAGTRLEIRRKVYGAGEISDGTRVFIVRPCNIWRWMTVTFGWSTLGEFDHRNFHDRPHELAAAILSLVENRTAAPYREELTEVGPQLVIPGCERVPPRNGKPAQLSLFG